MRNQQGDSSGDPVLTPGHSINPKHKVDENRHHGNDDDSSAMFLTAGKLQSDSQMPEVEPLQHAQPPALCRAIYDFNPKDMNLEDSKCCLSFLKVWFSYYLQQQTLFKA